MDILVVGIGLIVFACVLIILYQFQKVRVLRGSLSLLRTELDEQFHLRSERIPELITLVKKYKPQHESLELFVKARANYQTHSSVDNLIDAHRFFHQAFVLVKTTLGTSIDHDETTVVLNELSIIDSKIEQLLAQHARTFENYTATMHSFPLVFFKGFIKTELED